MTDPRVLVHRSLQPIRWGDMDAQGHVNNTLYFKYMEQARSEWIFSIIEGGGNKHDRGTVIVSASCEFLAPLSFPATIEVRMFIGIVGRSSVWSHYEIWDGETKAADGSAKIVWVQLSTGKALPLPDAIKAPVAAT